MSLPYVLPFSLGSDDSLLALSYARQLKQLLPPGPLWNLAPSSILSGVLTAIGDELARIQVRATDLLNEWDPRTTTEMIGDWETLLGLPDSCLVEIPDTLEGRRSSVFQKMVNRGGQTPAFYIELAAAVGFTVSISVYQVARAGLMRSGDRCYTDPWAYAWLVTLPVAALSAGLYVGGDVGEFLGQSGQLDVECIIERAAPAHTAVLFQYTG